MVIEQVYNYILELDRRHHETGEILQTCQAVIKSVMRPRMTFDRIRDVVIVKGREYVFTPQPFDIILQVESQGGRMHFVDLIARIWPDERKPPLAILERRLCVALSRTRHIMEEIGFPFSISNDDGNVVLFEARPIYAAAVV